MASYGNPVYRQSYVEKDRCVRNSTVVKVPGVDVMQGFALSKTEFEQVFLQTAENFEAAEHQQEGYPQSENRPPLSRANNRFNRQRKQGPRKPGKGYSRDESERLQKKTNQHASNDRLDYNRPFRGGASTNKKELVFGSPDEAANFADHCRRDGALLQRSTPPNYEGAGELFERALDSRAKYGLFCTSENADAHVEYAQNLSKRGLTPEAEYHLRSAADIFRMLNARAARKYGDVLLYMAVVIDRQGRLAEAENFYRSALAVYRANKLSDDNVRVAIDSLSNNLRAQGRGEEVDTIVQRHFLGAVS